MLEIVIPFVLFIIILIMSFFLFKTLFKILAIFSGVLIIGAIVSGVLIYIDGKTYVERLPTNPLLIIFIDKEEVVGALHLIINQNKIQPVAKEEPIFRLAEQKEYEQIIELGYFKVITIQKEILYINEEQEKTINQSVFSLFTGTIESQQEEPRKRSPEYYENIITQEEREQLLKEQGKEIPQLPQDYTQLRTMLYAVALMQQAQSNPEKIKQALQEGKIKVYKTTIIIKLLKYIPSPLLGSLIKGA